MTGSRIGDIILMGISTTVLLLVLGLLAYHQYIYERPLPSNEEEQEKLFADAKASVYPEILKIDKIVINLPSRSSRLRFLEITLNIIPFKPGKIELVEANKAKINDIIIEIGSRMTPNELNSVSGKLLLKSRLKRALNKSLGEQFIKDLVFSKFVVQ